MISENLYYLVGFASGIAGADEHAGDGPIVIQQSPYLDELIKDGAQIEWRTMIKPSSNTTLPIQEILQSECKVLAQEIYSLVSQDARVCVLGGDHTSAIGTWSGVNEAIKDRGDLGLIWVDAHMDSHTPETSETGRLHGMPLACLLGHGYPELTTIMNPYPKLKPENVCLVGVRSFEFGEAAFLKQLGVKVYDMNEVKERGFPEVWAEAVERVNQSTCGYGLSIDVDAFDPSDAPGVDVPEPDGLFLNEFIQCLSKTSHNERLLATEIVEFDPLRDRNALTEQLVVKLIRVLV